MVDFLARLAERVLEPSQSVRPDTAPVFPSGDTHQRLRSLSLLERERAATTEGDTRVSPSFFLDERAATREGDARVSPSSFLDGPTANIVPRSQAPAFEAMAEHAPASAPAAAELRGAPSLPVSNGRASSVSVARAVVAQPHQEHQGRAPQHSELVQIQPRSAHDEALLEQRQPALAERASVKITIGRIDVRATAPNTLPFRAPSAAARGPQPRSLESYLGERNHRRP